MVPALPLSTFIASVPKPMEIDAFVEIDGAKAVSVRLIPFVTGWQLHPDNLVGLLTGRYSTLPGGSEKVLLRSYHLDEHGQYHAMLPRDWDVVRAVPGG